MSSGRHVHGPGTVGGNVPPERDSISAEAAGTWQSGSRIAGYRLENRIGQGGMAVIFRARDDRLGRLVALKILAPALVADDRFRQRFIAESRAAAAVDDPHIIPVFEAGEAEGVLFIAMRYVPGGDARSLLRRDGPLPPARAAAIVSPVASALDAAHTAGLVHRDVKPSNMLMDVRPGRPDHVYLSDFGLSKAALSSTGLTGTGTFLGTVDYIAPEQIQGKPVDGRADQYALACAAFELLTGQPPFRREEAAAVVYAQLSEPPPALTARRPDLPPDADGVVAKAMAKAPGDRYATCRDFADALRAALGLASYAPASGRPGARVTRRPRSWACLRRTRRSPRRGRLPPAGVAVPAGWAAPGVWVVPAGRAAPAATAVRLPRRGGAGGAPAVFAGVAVLAVAAVVAGIALAGGPAPRPAVHHPSAIQIAAKSRLAPVSGDVYVGYRAWRGRHRPDPGAGERSGPGRGGRAVRPAVPVRQAAGPGRLGHPGSREERGVLVHGDAVDGHALYGPGVPGQLRDGGGGSLTGRHGLRRPVGRVQ